MSLLVFWDSVVYFWGKYSTVPSNRLTVRHLPIYLSIVNVIEQFLACIGPTTESACSDVNNYHLSSLHAHAPLLRLNPLSSGVGLPAPRLPFWRQTTSRGCGTSLHFLSTDSPWQTTEDPPITNAALHPICLLSLLIKLYGLQWRRRRRPPPEDVYCIQANTRLPCKLELKHSHGELWTANVGQY